MQRVWPAVGWPVSEFSTGVRKDGSFNISRKTLCAVCGVRLGGQSWCQPEWNDYLPTHFTCAYPRDEVAG